MPPARPLATDRREVAPARIERFVLLADPRHHPMSDRRLSSSGRAVKVQQMSRCAPAARHESPVFTGFLGSGRVDLGVQIKSPRHRVNGPGMALKVEASARPPA